MSTPKILSIIFPINPAKINNKNFCALKSTKIIAEEITRIEPMIPPNVPINETPPETPLAVSLNIVIKYVFFPNKFRFLSTTYLRQIQKQRRYTKNTIHYSVECNPDKQGPSGVYLFRIDARKFSDVKKMIVVK